MKFLHISDLHIGKYVNGYRMLDDQRYMLERIVEIIKEKNPDALLIAGDIYDKSLPSAEAVELFDSFMTEIAGLHGKTGLKTFVISGNHDSPERIGYFNKLIELNGIFTDGVFEGIARKILLNVTEKGLIFSRCRLSVRHLCVRYIPKNRLKLPTIQLLSGLCLNIPKSMPMKPIF